MNYEELIENWLVYADYCIEEGNEKAGNYIHFVLSTADEPKNVHPFDYVYNFDIWFFTHKTGLRKTYLYQTVETYGGWRGYTRYTIVNGPHKPTSQSKNKKNLIIKRSGKLFEGTTSRCEAQKWLKENKPICTQTPDNYDLKNTLNSNLTVIKSKKGKYAIYDEKEKIKDFLFSVEFPKFLSINSIEDDIEATIYYSLINNYIKNNSLNL